MVLTEQDQSDDEDEDDDEDDEDDEEDNEVITPVEKKTEKQKQKAKKCTVLVELLQKNRRQRNKVHFLYVAFHVYKVTRPLLNYSTLSLPVV